MQTNAQHIKINLERKKGPLYKRTESNRGIPLLHREFNSISIHHARKPTMWEPSLIPAPTSLTLASSAASSLQTDLRSTLLFLPQHLVHGSSLPLSLPLPRSSPALACPTAIYTGPQLSLNMGRITSQPAPIPTVHRAHTHTPSYCTAPGTPAQCPIPRAKHSI